MFGSSWLKTTKQLWKLNLFLIVIIIASVLFPLGLKYDRPEFILAFMVLGIIASIWFIYSIKCPFCKYRIVKYQFFNEKYKFDWFEEILYRKSCPSCGKEFSRR